MIFGPLSADDGLVRLGVSAPILRNNSVSATTSFGMTGKTQTRAPSDPLRYQCGPARDREGSDQCQMRGGRP